MALYGHARGSRRHHHRSSLHRGRRQRELLVPASRPTSRPDASGATGWTLGGSNLDAEQSIFTDPDWDGDLQIQGLDDIGVIVLDTSVTGVEPATIAPLGTLDGLPRGTLFTLVGFGIHYEKPTDGPRKPMPVAGLERSWTTSPMSNLTRDTLMLAASPDDKRGGGTICSGTPAARCSTRGFWWQSRARERRSFAGPAKADSSVSTPRTRMSSRTLRQLGVSRPVGKVVLDLERDIWRRVLSRCVT